MGAIGGLLGTAGGASGSGFAAPDQADIKSGATPEQLAQSYAGAQQGIAGQQKLLEALQGGVQNQNSAFGQQQNLATQLQWNDAPANAAQAYKLSEGLHGQLAGANGVGNQSAALAAQQQLAQQQQGTANQYQDIALGRGPNPAQAMLNNATGQNVANQAALMAGQRGAGANVGLMARQAAQQGAATQQQAVGQGALMQAQQQIAGLGGLSGAQQAIGATNQNAAGIAGQLTAAQQAQQQSMANQASNQVNQQQTAQNSLAATAQNQAQNQIGATTGVSQAQQAQQGAMLGALGNYNSNITNQQGSVNAGNTALAGKNMEGQQAMIGGLMNAAGPAATMLGGPAAAAGGGAAGAGGMGGGGSTMIPAGAVSMGAFADGGQVGTMPPPVDAPPPGPSSSFGGFLKDWGAGMKAQSALAGNPNAPGAQMGEASAGSRALKQGTSNLLQSLVKMAPAAAMAAAKGGMAERGGAVNAKSPSQHAVKSGNSYDNDKIPAMLSEGEVVIPRAVMQSGDPVRGAATFVAQVMAKRGKK